MVIRAGRVFASHSHVAQALYKAADIFPMCVELRWERKNDLCLQHFFIKLNPNSPKKGWAPLIVNYCFFNKKFNDPSKNFNDHKLTNVEQTVLKVEAVIIFQERVLKFTHIFSLHYPTPPPP